MSEKWKLYDFDEWNKYIQGLGKELKGKTSKGNPLERRYKVGDTVFLPGTTAPLKVVELVGASELIVQRPGGYRIHVEEGDIVE